VEPSDHDHPDGSRSYAYGGRTSDEAKYEEEPDGDLTAGCVTELRDQPIGYVHRRKWRVLRLSRISDIRYHDFLDMWVE
jgi:hypothetical protein